jgi:hypothetical protein
MNSDFELLPKGASGTKGAPHGNTAPPTTTALRQKAGSKDAVAVAGNVGLDEMACEEILRLIHSVFRTPGQERRAVVFAAISSGSGCS